VIRLETSRTFAVGEYDLAATFSSGQAFRWEWQAPHWIGVIGSRRVRLSQSPGSITAETAQPVGDWAWLTHYLQLHIDLNEVIGAFPNDAPMRTAVAACRGLRLLRQDPWECLASFILSSTKQIVQIRQIIAFLCARFGEPLPVTPGWPPAFAFPSAARLACGTEAELRACKTGFRAPYLRETAGLIASGRFDLAAVQRLPLELARKTLMCLPGVGSKIADCVLLFAYGFDSAFPVDVWVDKALRQLYFPQRRIKPRHLHHFAVRHFGSRAGYAQQYLFHYMRVIGHRSSHPV